MNPLLRAGRSMAIRSEAGPQPAGSIKDRKIEGWGKW